MLKLGALGCAGIGLGAGFIDHQWWERDLSAAPPLPTPSPPSQWAVEARFYTSFIGEGSLNCAACHEDTNESLEVSYCHTPHTGPYVQCNLCPHRCVIADGERGRCRVRENRGGRLYSLVYGNPCAVHVDPIEKKPFFHFLPGAAALSLATAGCNLRCLYCQNWTISQVPPEKTSNISLPPEVVADYAQHAGAQVIAYTYSEPTVFYEYMMDTATLTRKANLRNVVVTAGFINQEPLRALCDVVDAIKIDLKGYSETFYRDVCSGKLEPVLEAIKTIYDSGTHLEIVNLVVPTLNDDLEQLRDLARWLVREVSPDVPLHFSRFYPQYKLTNLPPTPVETLTTARNIAMEEGVKFVYVGNVPGHPGNNTYCPRCGRPIIVRQGFAVLEYHIKDGACAYCGEPIPGVWWPDKPPRSPVEMPPGPADQ
ncbi:MAG: AmmeMemoRadiSam system radical SAM enzyme [Anaerolineae bacterium]|nr:AmmeMemoRadiSam system radical SAM enzyme [Anaerolineae bacterium]